MRSHIRFIYAALAAAALPMFMSAEMDAAVASVENLETVGDSVVAAFQALGPQIVDAAGDKEKSIALGNEVTAKAAVWAAAIVANTPAAPATPAASS